MLTDTFRFLSVLLVAVSMAAGFAHLLELPNKIDLPREDYLTVQQLSVGGPSWASRPSSHSCRRWCSAYSYA